jgi:CheY-like chemotaxis protein
VPKILVADDNANIQKMVSLSFEDRGIQVIAVGNGEAAVRRIPDLQPDLVLADIFMPVRNGYEVCEFVKKDERFSHVPVILLVGAFDPLDEKEARRVGADGVLKKPFVPPDPLIAMVMSALEKNPKIAAELAKAKEAKAAVAPPPEPETAPIPEPANSARAEIKPLPDFPEPSPEEAALVYGFGTGKRALDEALEEPSAGPKPPVAPANETEEAADEDFEGAATTRDWRRNAMDIEIPADVANKPAFASSDDLEQAMFPSERDVPPRHVRVPEAAEEPAALVKAPEPVQAEPVTIEHVASEEPEAEYFSSLHTPAPDESKQEPTAQSMPVVEPEPAHEAEPQPAPSHWMDQLAQGSSEQPRADWMSVLSEQSATPSFPAASSEPPPHEASAESVAPPAADADVEQVEHFNSNPWSTSESSSIPQDKADEAFFADEPSASSSSDSWLSPPAPVAETAHEVVETTSADAVPVVASKTDDNFDVESDFAPPISGKDPELVEPPAVHVNPEPLLVEDEPAAPSQYGSHAEEREPLHSFFAPPLPAPAADEAPAQDFSRRIEPPVALAEPESTGPSERVPTGPPPNREVLAEIPFLTPPPEFRAQVSDKPATDSGTVDAVVQKVLEKLEPQLHDLLSQGVLKPLVENLLQSELTKKEK